MGYTAQFEHGVFAFHFDYGVVGHGILIDPETARLDDPLWREAYARAVEAYDNWSLVLDYAHEGTQQDCQRLSDGELQVIVTIGTDILNGNSQGFRTDSWVMGSIRKYVERANREIQKRAYKPVKKPKPDTGFTLHRYVPGYVYLIQSPTGAYKIGRTKNPADRLKTFSVKLPFEVEFVCVIESHNMIELESDLHARYADKRVNGEWFNLDAADVEAIKAMAVQS